MSLFNRHIAAVLPKLAWRHFGVGALQAYLFEGEHIEQRLHIWHPSLVREGIRGFGDCHDHRFSFKSEVLCGAIVNDEYRAAADPEGEFDLYEVENARAAKDRTGSFDGGCKLVGRRTATLTHQRSYLAGESYEFPRGRFHRSSFLGTTVTVVTKFDQLDVRARILCPHGKPLVHAFGAAEPDVQTVLLDAQKALCR